MWLDHHVIISRPVTWSIQNDDICISDMTRQSTDFGRFRIFLVLLTSAIECHLYNEKSGSFFIKFDNDLSVQATSISELMKFLKFSVLIFHIDCGIFIVHFIEIAIFEEKRSRSRSFDNRHAQMSRIRHQQIMSSKLSPIAMWQKSPKVRLISFYKNSKDTWHKMTSADLKRAFYVWTS